MRRALGTALLLAACIGAGCGGPAQLRYEQEVAHAPQSAEHAVHGRRLAQLMRELDRLRRERLPQAIDLRAEETRKAGEIARVASAMAEAADRIPEAASDVGLAGEEREAFTALAESLARRSRRLADDAGNISATAVQVRLRTIETDCEACHQRFRIPRVVP
ncbi:MAG: cytochrome c [Deltaproteobacteria bacterium]|nr:cytochrome c [Deltaproteobacteria bacterium]MBW2361775.1 cytochrome c [Deltaproteobacteria bacterium]